MLNASVAAPPAAPAALTLSAISQEERLRVVHEKIEALIKLLESNKRWAEIVDELKVSLCTIIKKLKNIQKDGDAYKLAREILGSIKGPHARDEAFQQGLIDSLRMIVKMINNFQKGNIP